MTEEELIRKAMSVLGSRKTPKKTAASRASIPLAQAARTGQPLSDEHRANLRTAQAARRERERSAKQSREQS